MAVQKALPESLRPHFLAVLLLLLAAGRWAAAADPDQATPDQAGAQYFEQKVRPLLVEHCYECHSAESKQLGGGLRLDSRAGVLKGGDSGPALHPGKPDESLLIRAVRYTDEAVQMPPTGKLPAAAIAELEAWVARGAPDPREAPAAPAAPEETWQQTLERRAKWWSLQGVARPAVPTPRRGDWSQHPVDRFLLTKLESESLEPAAAADPRTLARRLSLVLTGLPPEREALDALLAECSTVPMSEVLPAQAVERYVDRLLASPHFGERWARHWLDVVRFSETHGNEWNYEVHHAWRYRDYLIRAFNDDLPYDRFIREHIAGDLLPQPRWNQQQRFNESLIATGFYRFGEVNHDDCISLRSIGYDLADNQIDTLTKAFQATTVACARCHNHKLDAVSMEDYYALLGVIRSSRQVSHCIDAPEVNAEILQRLGQVKPGVRRLLAEEWQQDVLQLPSLLAAAEAAHAQSPNAEALTSGLNGQSVKQLQEVLAAEKLPLEDPLSTWREIARSPQGDATSWATTWQTLAERFAKERDQRAKSNAEQYTVFADFRGGAFPEWRVGGQAFRTKPTRSGDFALHAEGDVIVRSILPAGAYTHSLSEKLNGTLRSPVLPLGKKHISFQVLGRRSSAVRLVSNNCQLNYKNYRALTSDELGWVTFSPPEDRDALLTYAELMTMFDNPKFPDQLSALGGDKDNYKLPWDEAASNPRSYFGVTRVVLHDTPEPPQAELAHLQPLFAPGMPPSQEELSARYVVIAQQTLRAWADDTASDEDVRWIDALLRRGVLRNRLADLPRLQSAIDAYRHAEAELAVPRVALGFGDGGPGIDQPLLVRGDSARPSTTVPRRYLGILAKSQEPYPADGSGRLQLAEQIAAADNPLTARVMVNRIWHHLFGAGLVRTVDDFGHVGDTPSHAELLDYLAATFVEEGWSIKRMIRSLVLTRAFQMSHVASAASREVDPVNRLLQHYPSRRMEAEAVRDSILVTSGRLDRKLYGPSVQPYREKPYVDRRLFPGPLDGDGRRSIYIKNNLMEGPKFLAAFNFPGGKVTQGRRDVTNVPAQALALLNDPFVLQQAELWGKALVARNDSTPQQRIEAMFQAALGRPPAGSEQAQCLQTVRELAGLHQIDPAAVLQSEAVWKDLAHAMFNVSEFIYIP